jgi:carboxypeptidase Taq
VNSAAYAELRKLLREGATLGAIGSLLNWDQETYMPHAAAGFRAEQASMMASLAHAKRTSPRLGELIEACEKDRGVLEHADEAANLREIRRDYDLARKLPADLVAELALVGSQAQEAWKLAREKSDFAMFAPWLEKMLALTRRKAECYGVPAGGELYDALLDEYEPGMTSAQIEAIFTPLRDRLSSLIALVREEGGKVSTKCINVKVDTGKQHEFGQYVLNAMGFDLGAGRLDVTTHPFCSGMAPGDTRLTTRYRGEKFTDALYGTLHEMGHGLYEQGLPKLGEQGRFGEPLADAISLGIHESQSRMWENFVGRSKAFWKWALPKARKHFREGKKSPLDKYGVKDLYAAVNTVTPSLIRVEADEGTYNLHVMIRFELERALISGDLKVADLPAAWNARYADYLGVEVPDDRRGCLQDVHWSFGLMGYFPTYTLGNLYAAQFWETILEQIPDLQDQIAEGEFGALLGWLRENIHRHGRRHRAADLCAMVTGKPLSADPLMRHLARKAEQVYGVTLEEPAVAG